MSGAWEEIEGHPKRPRFATTMFSDIEPGDQAYGYAYEATCRLEGGQDESAVWRLLDAAILTAERLGMTEIQSGLATARGWIARKSEATSGQ